MKRLIHTAVLAAALAFALLLCGCSGAETSHKAPQRAAVESGERQFAQPSDGDFIAIFSTSLGEVRAVLYPDAAPMAVQNFVGLARSGYYDNTVIWRAQYGFAVQGGDAGGTGSGGATIWSNNPYPLEADSTCATMPVRSARPLPRRRGDGRQQPVLFCHSPAKQRG